MWTIHTRADCNLEDTDMPDPPLITTSTSKSVPTGQVSRDLAASQDQEMGSILQAEWWRFQGDIHSDIPSLISFIIASLAMYDTGLTGDLSLTLWFIVGFPWYIWTWFPRQCYESWRRLPSEKGTWDVSSYLYKQAGSLWEHLDRFIESWPTNRRRQAPFHGEGFIKNILYTVRFARSSDWSEVWLARSSGMPVALDLVFALFYKYWEIECLLRIYHLEASGRLSTPFSVDRASFWHWLLSHQYQ